MKIVHVIQRLSRGGAARAMLVQIKYTQRLGMFEHVIVSLVPPEPAALALAREANARVVHSTERAQVDAVTGSADLVQVHFWNTPELYAWLDLPTPPARILLMLPIAGDSPAQVITRAVLECADFVVAQSSYTLDLPIMQALDANKLALILTVTDTERFASTVPQTHSTFNIGYIGTVDFVKMHPHYVKMSAAAHIPEAQFIVAGNGDAFRTLEQQARALNASERFVWRGYLNDPRALLETLDLLGYPLRPDNYSASDLVLQETMWAGIPAVILPYGGTARLIQHNETGWIADTEDDYPAALEYLFQNPAERRRLGENARTYAHEFFDATRTARALCAVYENVCAMPKRVHHLQRESVSPHAGANAFVGALDGFAPEFRLSLIGGEDGLRADEQIAHTSPILADAASGGVVAYRRYYPNDPFLSLWSGLVLEHAGRYALAAAEYQRAQTLGLGQPRVLDYLTRVMGRAAQARD